MLEESPSLLTKSFAAVVQEFLQSHVATDTWALVTGHLCFLTGEDWSLQISVNEKLVRSSHRRNAGHSDIETTSGQGDIETLSNSFHIKPETGQSGVGCSLSKKDYNSHSSKRKRKSLSSVAPELTVPSEVSATDFPSSSSVSTKDFPLSSTSTSEFPSFSSGDLSSTSSASFKQKQHAETTRTCLQPSLTAVRPSNISHSPDRSDEDVSSEDVKPVLLFPDDVKEETNDISTNYLSPNYFSRNYLSGLNDCQTELKEELAVGSSSSSFQQATKEGISKSSVNGNVSSECGGCKEEPMLCSTDSKNPGSSSDCPEMYRVSSQTHLSTTLGPDGDNLHTSSHTEYQDPDLHMTQYAPKDNDSLSSFCSDTTESSPRPHHLEDKEENTGPVHVEVAARFANTTAADRNRIRDSAQSKATKKQTKWVVKIFKDWLASRQYDTNFETLSAEDLDDRLEVFYTQVRSKTGEKYSLSQFRGIRAGINRHLNDSQNNRNMCIMTGEQFKKSNSMYKAVLKDIRSTGTTTHYNFISENDLEKLKSPDSFKLNDPKQLQEKVFFDLQLSFEYRGGENLRNLKKNFFTFGKDDDGFEYIEFNHHKKTKKPQNYNTYQEKPRLYETKTKTCPLKSFQLYVSKLPASCDLFFTKARCGKQFNPEREHTWYTTVPTGIRSLQQMMKNISKRLNLTELYTNHCIRATTVYIISAYGIPTRQIMRTTNVRV